MLLSNDFVVAADLDQVWEHLLDMENVAACVPGAKVEEVVPPATYKGTIRLKIGPMTVTYRGQATLVHADGATHEATIEMKARESRGQGSALATVRNRLEQAPGGTRVIAETDLQITGPQAQFGKGVLEDVGGRILEEFSARLESQINGEHAAAGSATSPGSAGAGASAASPREHEGPSTRPGAGSALGSERHPPGGDEDALDLTGALGATLRARAPKLAGVGAGAILLLVVLALLRRAVAGGRS